jgi:hypothetical protein
VGSIALVCTKPFRPVFPAITACYILLSILTGIASNYEADKNAHRTKRPNNASRLLRLYFNYNSLVPTSKNEPLHIVSIPLQIMLASWGPMAELLYGVLVLLLKNPKTYELLTREIGETFSSYDEIISGPNLTSLTYLHACIEETLRMLPSNNKGLLRVSPGAMVNGQYISGGVSTIFKALPSSFVLLLSCLIGFITLFSLQMLILSSLLIFDST